MAEPDDESEGQEWKEAVPSHIKDHTRTAFCNLQPCSPLLTISALTYFVMPNYSDYSCANFFIFNERSQCYFQDKTDLLNVYESVFKRVIVVSNTNEENFRKAISYHSKAEPEILFFSARKYGKSSIKDDLLTSEKSTCRYYSFVQRSILMSVTN